MAGVDQILTLVADDGSFADAATPELLRVLIDSSATSAITTVAALIDAGDRAIRSGDPEELRALAGIAPNDARRLAAAFELARRGAAPSVPSELRGPADVATVAQRVLGLRRRERLIAIVCDPANRPTRAVLVADGAIDRCRFPVREILNAVLRFDGCAFALAHNHPAGASAPSDTDVAATSAVAAAARIVGLRFLGHVVVADDGWHEVSIPSRIPG